GGPCRGDKSARCPRSRRDGRGGRRHLGVGGVSRARRPSPPGRRRPLVARGWRAFSGGEEKGERFGATLGGSRRVRATGEGSICPATHAPPGWSRHLSWETRRGRKAARPLLRLGGGSRAARARRRVFSGHDLRGS